MGECHWCWSPQSCLSHRAFGFISHFCPHLMCLASLPPASLSCQKGNTHVSQSKARAPCGATRVELCSEGWCEQYCLPCPFQAWHIWSSIEGHSQVLLVWNVAQWSASMLARLPPPPHSISLLLVFIADIRHHTGWHSVTLGGFCFCDLVQSPVGAS